MKLVEAQVDAAANMKPWRMRAIVAFLVLLGLMSAIAIVMSLASSAGEWRFAIDDIALALAFLAAASFLILRWRAGWFLGLAALGISITLRAVTLYQVLATAGRPMPVLVAHTTLLLFALAVLALLYDSSVRTILRVTGAMALWATLMLIVLVGAVMVALPTVAGWR